MIYTYLFIKIFFSHFGKQNYYAWDAEGNDKDMPTKPHLWKTRIGFSTACGLAKIICS